MTAGLSHHISLGPQSWTPSWRDWWSGVSEASSAGETDKDTVSPPLSLCLCVSVAVFSRHKFVVIAFRLSDTDV